MQANLLLIGLYFPQEFLLLRIIKTIDKVKSLVPCLQHYFCDLFTFALNGLDDKILRVSRDTILDFSCSKAEMRVRMLSCILLYVARIFS